MSPADFRAIFAEFDLVNYPDPMVSIWLGQAANEVDPTRWGSDTNYGVALLTAHYVTLAKRRANAAAAGGTPGEVSGPISSKAVAGVTVARDTSAVRLEGAGSFNSTEYGALFWQKARFIGAGALQINAC